jgi:hypothetical protein
MWIVHLVLGVAEDLPNPPPKPPPGLDVAAETFLAWLKWGAMIAGVVGLTICGVMMMIGRRHRSSTAVEGAAGIPWVLMGLSVVVFAAGIVAEVFR